MMNRHWIRRGLLGALGASIALGSLAGCAGRFGGHGDGWGAGGRSAEERAQMRERMVERVAKRLDLDAAQKAKLQVLASTMQAQREAVMGGTDMRADMAALIAGPSFDRNRAQVIVQQKTQAVQGAAPAVIAAFGDFYDSLNPTQQQQVREFMARRGGRGHGHGPHRGASGPQA